MRRILESTGLAMAMALTVSVGCYQGATTRKDPVRIEVLAGEDLLSVRDKVRDIPASDRARGVEIVLADGEYFLSQVLGFGSSDSGGMHSPVVWKAKNPGKAVLRADIRVPAASFRPVEDPALLTRLPKKARGKVFVADLSKLVPGTLVELKDSFEGAPPPPVVLVDDRFGTLARWPNAPKSTRPKPDEGFASFVQAVDKGTKSKWSDDGRDYFEGGAFVFDDQRARRWHFDKGVWLSGYWSYDWNFASIRAASYGIENGTNNVLRMIDGKPYPYGVLNYRTGQYGRRFYVFNLLDEIDDPGEWWLDRAQKLLYLYPPKGKVSPDTDVSILLKNAEMISGKGLKNVRFEGLVFERNYATLVNLLETENVMFSECAFRFSAQNGLNLEGLRARVSGCSFSDLGRDGIHMKGGDRKTLSSSGNVIENCCIRRFGRLQKTYSGGIKAFGVGLAIRGNEICDAPHTAIFYETNDSVIETNDIHHVMLEAEDAGAIYTGRDLTTQGNVIRGNFIHECADWTSLDGDSTMGIYFDDRDAGDTVCDNVFWRLSIGVFVNGGRDHPIERNVFCECRRAVSIGFCGLRQAQRRKPGERDPLIVKAEKLGFRDEPWKSRYPRLAAIESQEPNLPLGNDVVANVFIDSDDDILRIDDYGIAPAVSNEVRKLVVRDNVVHASGVKFKTMPNRDALRSGFRAARPGEVEKWLSRTRIIR